MFLNFFRSILSPRLHAEGTCRETMFTLNNIHDVLCHSLFDALFFFGGFHFSGLRPSFLSFSFSIYRLAHRQIYGKWCETKSLGKVKEVKIHLRHPECPNVGALKGNTTPCLARFELSLESGSGSINYCNHDGNKLVNMLSNSFFNSVHKYDLLKLLRPHYT